MGTNPVFDRRDRIRKRHYALKTERASWDGHWRELSENILPRNGRWLITDRNKGGRRHNSIYDSSATKANRTLAAGMMAGMTSPARPWFRLSVPDKDLMKSEPVKVWLNVVTKMMLDIFSASNTYRALHSIYEELGAFGTGATLVAPNFNNVIHHHVQTVGQYVAATNFEGTVDTVYREFQKPVGAIVKEFGLDKVSNTIRQAYDNGDYFNWHTIVHAVEPRADRDPSKIDNQNMPYRSCYFDPADNAGSSPRYLRESGFKDFPALVPRWAVLGEDVYGISPGMEALGDIKQLQHEQLRKAQGIDYMTKPPLQMPTAYKGQEHNLLPGGVSYVDSNAPSGGIRSAFDVNLRLDYLLADIQDVRQRIQSAFYADLFLMLAQAGTNLRMTATEVAERHEEKMLMLGPVLERLHTELLNPLIDMTFTQIVRAGVLPIPPPEMNGMTIEVEFVSMLAQAQRAVSTNATDRWIGTLGAVANLGRADILDRLDADRLAEEYADQLGVNPELIVPDKQVAIIRADRAKQQQEAAVAAQTESAAKSAGAMAGAAAAAPGGDILGMFSGYDSPQPYAR